jgi:hypothetical protein
MGHDEHFLRRLDRVSDHHVELSLTLYRDAELLREVLSRADLPPGVERLAISLNDATEGPFVIVTRSGHFVTCLGEGMRVGSDMVVLTRPRLDAAISKVERMRERIARVVMLEREGHDGTAAMLLKKLNAEGLRFCREDAETLIQVWPLLGRQAANLFAEMVGSLGATVERLAGMRFDRLHPRELEAVESFGRVAWASSNLLVLSTQLDSAEHLKLFEERFNFNARMAIWQILFGLGTFTHGLRTLWSIAQGRGDAFAALRAQRDLTNQEEIGMRELGYGVIALKSSKLRAEATKAITPEWKGETLPEGATPRERWSFDIRRKASAFGFQARTAVLHPEALDAMYLHNGHLGACRFFHRTMEPTPQMLAAIPEDVARAFLPSLPYCWVGNPSLENLGYSLPWLARAQPGELFLPRAFAEQMPPTRTQDVIKVLQEVGVGLGIGRRETRRNEGPKVGRNDACTCGSGKKYKRCCGK